MKKLDNLSRSLRGKAFDQIDTSSIISKLKHLAMSYLTTVSTINGHIQDGNSEEAAAALKAAVGEEVLTDNGISTTQRGSHEVNFLKIPEVDSSVSSAQDVTPQDLSDKQVAQFLDPQMFAELNEHARDFVDILDGIKLEHLNPTIKQEKKPTKPKLKDNGKHTEYSNPPNFLSHSGIENMFRQHKPGMHGTRSIMSMLGSSVLKDHRDVIMAKHQARQEALGGGFCPVKCEANEWECNCQRLFSCVNNMDSYDLAVLIAGG